MDYIGTKFYKNGYSQEEYTSCAVWCNETQKATIVDMGEYYECVTLPEPTELELAEQEISELKQYLSDTDYCAIKCGELGLSMATEYPEEYQKRIDARARINELEEQYGL